MYILLLSIVLLLVLALGAHRFFGWAMAETSEDGGAAARARRERSFHDPRTWAAFRRWLNQKPPLLWSRRDRRGRFRKMR